jgi:hypothetical protein
VQVMWEIDCRSDTVKRLNIVFGVNFVSSSLSFIKYCAACTEGNYSYPYFKMSVKTGSTIRVGPQQGAH